VKNPARMTKAELVARVRALERVGSPSKEGFGPDRLLHEFQVHQVEIETQNAELREAQRLLEVSRDRYADLYDYAPVGYVTLDDKGIVREANLPAAAMLGTERARLVGTPFHLHVAREDLPRFRAHLRQLGTPNAAVTTEMQLLSKPTRVLSVVMQCVPVFIASEKGCLWRCAITDITELRRAEGAQRDDEARLRAILDSAVDGIITIDERGSIESFNPAAERMFGYQASEVVGRNVSLLMPSPHREAHDRYLSDYRATGRRKIIGIGREVEGVRKDGRRMPIDLAIGEVQLDGRRMYTGFLRDITARKHAEGALRESEEMFRSLSESSPVGICRTNAAGQCVFTNRRWQDITGLTAEACLGDGWLKAVHSQDLGRLSAEWTKASGASVDFAGQFRIVRPDGEVRWINALAKPVLSADGKSLGYVGIDEDITERRRSEIRRRLEYDLVHLLATVRDFKRAVPRLLQLLADGMEWDVGELWQVDSGSGNLRMVSVWHAPARKLGAFVRHSRTLRFSMFDGLPGKVLSSGRPAWIPNIADCPHFKRRDEAARAGLRAALAFPILFDGQVGGVMAFLSRRASPPDEGLLQVLAGLGLQIGQFIERERAVAELHRSEAALARAQQIARVGSYEIDVPLGGVIRGSAEFFRLIGLSPSKGMSTCNYQKRVVHPKDRERFRVGLQRSIEQASRFDMEYRIVRPDGADTQVRSIAEPVLGPGEKVLRMVGTLQDITERKELEREILEISERERRRFGRDLHDGLSQQLVAMDFFCQTLLEDMRSQAPGLVKAFGRLSKELRETIRQTRALSHGLSPVQMDAEGLMLALRKLAEHTAAMAKVDCDFDCEGKVRIVDAAAALHLYRIVQEAVTNALRHGRARRIRIALAERGDRVEVTVHDNGIGFPKRPRATDGMGLRVMKYRSGLIGATLDVASLPGKGVRVNCSYPQPT